MFISKSILSVYAYWGMFYVHRIWHWRDYISEYKVVLNIVKKMRGTLLLSLAKDWGPYKTLISLLMLVADMTFDVRSGNGTDAVDSN